MRQRTKTPTLEQIKGWGATTDVVTAGKAFGIGRNRAYELAKDGNFPVRVIPVGRNYRVVVAEILAILDVSSDVRDAA